MLFGVCVHYDKHDRNEHDVDVGVCVCVVLFDQIDIICVCVLVCRCVGVFVCDGAKRHWTIYGVELCCNKF